MKGKRRIAMIGMVLSVGMISAGCAGTVKNEPQTEVKELELTDEKQDAHPLEETEKETGQEDRKPDAEAAEETEQDADETEPAGQTLNRAEGTESLGGKVQSPKEDGMILAQTTVSDEDGMVTLLNVEDAKKIPVKYTADTKVEHWTIQGGGAGIDMQEASFSDLEEGQGVEVEGNFEGEIFVATRVIIEVYE